MKMIRSTPVFPLMLAGLLLAGCATAHHNPVDGTSNPDKLAYRDVEARRPDFKEPFLRDGVVSEPARFSELSAGTPVARVQELLGEPLQKGSGSRGPEWDYNFKFRLPQSQNYLVCQYKVVFDGQGQTVRETVWRRQQCLNLVTQGARAG